MDSNASQPTDILLELRSKCCPELVEYIFSFTTSTHASAAGLFNLAIRPRLFKDTCTFLWVFAWCTPDEFVRQYHFEFAFSTGDLPLLKWMLTHALKWNLADIIAQFSIHDNNIHVYLYVFTLLDVSSPLLAMTDARNQLPLLHAELRRFATRHERIDLLELLQRSNFAAEIEATFFDLHLVFTMRNINLLEHTCKHRLFKPHDRPLHLALNRAWVDGLVYLLDTCGQRFLTWEKEDYPYLVPSNMASMKLHDLNIFPDDVCLECFERWFPRVGYWGMVVVYMNHNLLAQFLHEDDIILRKNLWPEYMTHMESAINEAILARDLDKIEYMSLNIPSLQPTFGAISAIIRKNDVELLRLLYKKFSEVKMHIRRDSLKSVLKAYMDDKYVESASLLPMMKFFETTIFMFITRYITINKNLIQKALKRQDIELVRWLLGHIGYFKDVENRRKLAEANGCEELEQLLQQIRLP